MRNVAKGSLAALKAAAVALGLWSGAPALAEVDPFATGWLLQPAQSRLDFQSVKQTAKGEAVLELSSFAKFVGDIDAGGAAEVRIFLDSVDTRIDLRNVRMRFLFLETFKFPEAVVRVQLDPAALAGLGQARRMTLTLPYELDLHGVVRQGSADVTVTLMSDDAVAVASVAPIAVVVADHGLAEGIVKLQEASGARIVPTGWISFDLMFRRNGLTGTSGTAAAEPTVKTVDEPAGLLSTEACAGRFDILSRSGNINFNSGSARLDVAGSAILDELVDIVQRCPGLRLEVGGHTDDDGDAAANLALSERRAAAVIAYLVSHGMAQTRFDQRGYGEAAPIVPNDSAENKRRNRRIGFEVTGN